MSSPLHKNIDVRCYLAMGDSLTAGYADGALYYEAQQNSYANILAKQFKLIGGGDFKQPLLEPGSVGIDLLEHSRLVLKMSEEINGTKNAELAFLAPRGDTGALSKNKYVTEGPFHNVSVPGAKIVSVLAAGYGNPANGPGNYNPFFTRMAADPASSSVISDALAMEPTFFSLFIGNNDALAFALKGGTEDCITPAFGLPGKGFDESLKIIINALTAHGAKGVIANIPDLISVPFFTVIPYNGLVLSAQKAEFLSNQYKHAGLHFLEGKNPFVLEDPLFVPAGLRQMKKGELLLCDMLLDKDKSFYLQGGLPIPKKYFLSVNEITRIQNAITDYNFLLETAAREKGLAFVNVNSLLKTAKKDRTYNPFTHHLDYKKKGIFSLDGLHPNAFGHALLANEFIRAINETYHMAIPLVKSARYRNLAFPE